jgi:pimeloyl-ACP methyl ester carboxylesterase
MKLKSVQIPGEGDALAGLCYLPDGSMRPTALILAHGLTSGKYSLDSLAGYLAVNGYISLTYDCVGHKLGATGGALLRIEQVAENLRDALNWLRQERLAERFVLIGHSLGAAAALRVAAWEQMVKRAVPLNDLAGIVCLCMGTEPTKGFESPIGKRMLEQRRDYVVGTPIARLVAQVEPMVARAVQELKPIPALFIAGKQDVLLAVERVAELAALVGAEMVAIDSSHLETPDRAKGTILTWLQAQGF